MIYHIINTRSVNSGIGIYYELLYYNVIVLMSDMRMRRLLALVLFTVWSTWGWAQGLVVSTHPIYLIAKEVTKGVEEPVLLLGNQSGHDVQLTPTQRKEIQDASLIIWLGKAHEAPLDKLLHQNSQAIALLDSGILTILPQRDLHGEVLANTVDSHVWLEPNNAVRIAFFIAALRAQQYPEYKAQYLANAQQFSKQMLQAKAQFKSSTQPKLYWTYHDAYQYLEHSLNLHLAGTLTSDPHVAPTVTQIKYLRDHRPNKAVCLLAEVSTNQSQYRNLQPVVFESVDESLAGENNFIAAWKKLATKTQACVLNAQKY